MTYKQIEASREVRLWLTQVVIPATAVVATAMSIPEVREPVVGKIKNMRESIKQKFKKD